MNRILAFHLPTDVEQWLHTLAVAALVAGAGSVADGDHWRTTVKLVVAAVAVFLKSYPLPSVPPPPAGN